MKIQVLGAHNCETRHTKLVSILIDDMIVIDAGGLTSSLSLESQLKIKAILLTHQHYDHIRDIPAIGMNFFLNNAVIEVLSIQPVYDALTTHLLNSEIYTEFHVQPQGRPTIKFTVVEPGEAEEIEGYSILAVPVSHGAPTVGYQVTAPDGKSVFYTGGTGPGLSGCWETISPHLLIIEVTASNGFEDFGKASGHLTPSLLKLELDSFREIRGYLPRVITVHMSPGLEKEIEAEIAMLAEELNASITLAYEGMQLQL